MNKVVMQGMVKAMMMKEALASCQMEGIGLDLTLKDLYLAELGHFKSKKKEEQFNRVVFQQNADGHNSEGVKE